MPSNNLAAEGRWTLYRLLADPARLRLLALTTKEELSVGELALLLDESQPNVSRHAAALRRGGLVAERRDGTRSYLRATPEVAMDPVVRDAASEGLRLCAEEGRLERIAEALKRRERPERAAQGLAETPDAGVQSAIELPVYVMAIAAFRGQRELALDACTHSGVALDVLAPFFRRVIAIAWDASQAKSAQQRINQRSYTNVELGLGSAGDGDWRTQIGAGANLVFANRILSQAGPLQAVVALSSLLAPGGELIAVEYQASGEQTARGPDGANPAGIGRAQLLDAIIAAGLVDARWIPVPAGFTGGHPIPWQIVHAMRPRE